MKKCLTLSIISILRICILSWQCYGDCCQLPLILTLIIQNESSSPQFPYSIQIHWSLNGKNLKSSNIFKQIETMINCISKLWLTGHMCLALTGSMVKCDQVHVQIKLTVWSNSIFSILDFMHMIYFQGKDSSNQMKMMFKEAGRKWSGTTNTCHNPLQE